MKKQIKKILYNFFIYLTSIFININNTYATSLINSNVQLSNNTVGFDPLFNDGDALQFNGSYNIIADVSSKIQAIDLNNYNNEKLYIDTSQLILGSIYDQNLLNNNINNLMEINISPNSELVLTGDNFNNNGSSSWVKNNNGIYPNSLYVNSFGPYNIYSGINKIILSNGSKININSMQALYNMGGTNYPITLTNAFDFIPSNNNSTLLYLTTDLTVTDSSVGNFGSIVGNNAETLTLKSQNLTTFKNSWLNTNSPPPNIIAGTPYGTVRGIGLLLLSDAIITDPTVSLVGLYASNLAGISIGDNLSNISSSLTIKPEGNWLTPDYVIGTTTSLLGGIANGGIWFANNGIYLSWTYVLPDSTLILDSSNANQSVHFTSPDTTIGGTIPATSVLNKGLLYGTMKDLVGNIKIYANNNPITLDAGLAGGISEYFTSFVPSSLGVFYNEKTYRLQSFKAEGNNNIDIMLPVYSQNFIFDCNASIHLINEAKTLHNVEVPSSLLGSNGTITLLQDIVPGSTLILNGGDYTLNSVTTINLGRTLNNDVKSYHLNASTSSVFVNDVNKIDTSSKLIFKGNVTVNSFFDGSNGQDGKGSKIKVEGSIIKNNTNEQSQLDLLQAATTIVFTPDSTIPYGKEFSFIIFDDSNGSGSVNVPKTLAANRPPSVGEVRFILDRTYADKLGIVTWNYNPETYTIYSITNSQNVIDVIKQYGGSPKTVKIVELLATPVSGNLTKSQAAALTDLGSADNILEAANSLVPLDVSSIASDITLSSITSHLNDEEIYVVPEDNGWRITEKSTGAAAGSNNKYGLWTNGLLYKAFQKPFNNVFGYKTKSFGSTLGFDTKINENSLIGISWTNINSIIKHQKFIGHSKSSVIHNFFSLYGINSLTESLMIQYHVSKGYGQSNSNLARYSKNGVTYASSIKKSKLYTANINLYKKINFNNYILEPVIGIEYYQFNDNKYQENYGSTNFNVASKKSYFIEGILGGKFIYGLEYKDCVVNPQISTHVNFNIRDKQGISKVSLNDLNYSVNLPKTYTTSAWYDFGLGMTIYKSSLELGLNYELQKDKKYLGHQETLKLRYVF